MKFFKNEQIFKNNDYFILLPNFLRIEPLDYNLDINLEDILFVEKQKKLIFENTNNFLKIKIQIISCFGVQEEWVNPH